jgi:hypothetical protein
MFTQSPQSRLLHVTSLSYFNQKQSLDSLKAFAELLGRNINSCTKFSRNSSSEQQLCLVLGTKLSFGGFPPLPMERLMVDYQLYAQ